MALLRRHKPLLRRLPRLRLLLELLGARRALLLALLRLLLAPRRLALLWRPRVLRADAARALRRRLGLGRRRRLGRRCQQCVHRNRLRLLPQNLSVGLCRFRLLRCFARRSVVRAARWRPTFLGARAVAVTDATVAAVRLARRRGGHRAGRAARRNLRRGHRLERNHARGFLQVGRLGWLGCLGLARLFRGRPVVTIGAGGVRVCAAAVAAAAACGRFARGGFEGFERNGACRRLQLLALA
eukprot:359275-Chlamydomonas_euryale.AAC.1